MTSTVDGVAVVLCTRDRAALLPDALDAARRYLRPQDEMIVVDSASRDPNVRRIIEERGHTYVRCERPGLSRARNAGARASTRTVIACTDDDCSPDETWTEAIEKAFAADSRAGFVTGMIVPDRQRRLALSVMIVEDPLTFSLGDDINTMGSGANMSFRRTAFDAVGGFDESLGAGAKLLGAEDQDFLWRILRAGFTGRYEPSSRVVHRQWRTDSQSLRQHLSYGMGRGAFLSKAARIDRDQGRAMRRKDLWENGFRSGWHNLRTGYESGAASDVLRAIGILAGLTRARFVPIHDGHFRA
jgi:GT2 family glycosyltransferase